MGFRLCLSFFLVVSLSAATSDLFREALRTSDGLVALKQEAESGNPRSQKLYADSLKSSLKFAAAEHWYRKAAVQGDPGALSALGELYHTTIGIETNVIKANHSRALVLHRLAAAQGNVQSQFHLFFAYKEGKVAKKDWVKAYEHLILSKRGIMEQGYAKPLIQELSHEQIAEAKRRAEMFRAVSFQTAFTELAFDSVRFSGVIGSGTDRFALLNGMPVSPGQLVTLDLGGLPARVRLETINADAAKLSFGGTERVVRPAKVGVKPD